MKKLILCIISIAAIVSCADTHETRVRDAVKNHLALYPKAHLQDLYKAFFQAEFGAEHIVADTTSAGRYLDSELSVKDNASVYYEPIGADSSFFRVHLRSVQDGFITRDQLFHAFVGGVHNVEIPQIERWSETWPEIIKVIDKMHLGLPDYAEERASIDSLLTTGYYASHHSQEFSVAYDPHYRIIRRDLFESQLLPYLPKQ